MEWFSFSPEDFSYAFLSVLMEGVPFILLGTLLSGLIDQFLPSRMMTRYLPRNAFLGICVSAAMGVVFPMCECGVVPVIRRLIAKLIFAAQSHPAFIWAWSRWRQAHQALAAFYHRKKRLQMQL